jgi:hypothetical protein
MKAAQMKDKRRAWEATPEFMKNTMVSERAPSLLVVFSSLSSVRVVYRHQQQH